MGINMQQWLITISTQHVYLIYAIIALITLIEGPTISILLGLLLRAGYFSLIPIYGSIMFGDLLGDTILYWIGYRYGHSVVSKFGERLKITNEEIAKAEALFHEKKTGILFLSKITNGFGFAILTLITAGVVKVPFGKYMAINFFGQLIWSGFLLSIGYFFGHIYMSVASSTGKFLIIFFYALIFYLFLFYGKKLREKLNH
jgi:membrane protein DedA with SNARE-associated domain